jgi:hypothetical protein
MVHLDVVAFAVLLLEISPVFWELSTKKVVPADGCLLLQQTLVTGGIWRWIKVVVTEETKEAFSNDVEEHGIYKVIDGLQ